HVHQLQARARPRDRQRVRGSAQSGSLPGGADPVQAAGNRPGDLLMPHADCSVGFAHRATTGSEGVTRMATPRPTSTPNPRLRLALACGALLAASACKSTFNDIIAVDPQDRVSENVLFDDPAQAALLTSSVQAQFECAFGTYILSTGLLINELNSLGATQMFSLDSHQPDKAGGF